MTIKNKFQRMFFKKKSPQVDVSRYARQLGLSEVGREGQTKLANAKVLVVGAGGLGCPAALYLAAAGVGTIGIIDEDKVDLSNLQRQIAYIEEDIGTPKVEALEKRLNGFNPKVKIVKYKEHLAHDNVGEIIKDYDIILNGCDNFPTRYLLNDACFFAKKPLVDGSVHRFIGQITFFSAGDGGPCYHCLYPEPPAGEEGLACASGGVIGALPGIIGSMQALEVIKFILGIGEPLTGRLLVFDALKQEFKEMRFQKDPNCPICK